MLFRSTLALVELYGPVLFTTTGDAITLLQSLAGSTCDSSQQLDFTACMGHMAAGNRLLELRGKHQPSVLVVIEERSRKTQVQSCSSDIVHLVELHDQFLY